VMIGGALLLVQLLPRYPPGALKIVPFPAHGALELISHRCAGRAQHLIVAGAALFLVWLVTDHKAAQAPQQANAAAPGVVGSHR